MTRILPTTLYTLIAAHAVASTFGVASVWAGEPSNTERELVDSLQTMKRDLDAGTKKGPATNNGGYDDQVLTHTAKPSRSAGDLKAGSAEPKPGRPMMDEPFDLKVTGSTGRGTKKKDKE